MPRSFALGDHSEEFIDAQVNGGRYNNASEVVRDALRLEEDRSGSDKSNCDVCWIKARQAVCPTNQARRPWTDLKQNTAE